MNKLLYTLAVLLSFSHLQAQILPAEGSKLNYRFVGFSFPGNNATAFNVEIAEGTHKEEAEFKKKIITAQSSTHNRILIELPSFGKEYTWRVTYTSGNTTSYSTMHHFSIAYLPKQEGDTTRLRITRNTINKSSYVFVDATQTLYDMDGNPIWFLPLVDEQLNNAPIRDLKLTSHGTITFLIGNKQNQAAYEIDYNGNILWKAPDNGKISGDTTEYYHHEFTRLHNGNYILLGSQQVNARIPMSFDSGITVYYKNNKNGPGNTKIPFGTLIEYNKTGNIVWSWRSSHYFSESDLAYRKTPRARTSVDVHDNGFFFDEKNNLVYLSFRNINRVIKIQYPSGKVLNTYGERFKAGFNQNKETLFCGQHAPRVTDNGDLYLFNNNICHPGSFPEIIVMKQPLSEKDTLKKIWEYECVIDGIDKNERAGLRFETFGNVICLPDSSFFASMSSVNYSKIFIVKTDKTVTWSAVPERWFPEENRWVNMPVYRSSIIYDREMFENMIWYSGKR